MGDCEKVESENAALGIFVALLLLQLQILHGVLQDISSLGFGDTQNPRAPTFVTCCNHAEMWWDYKNVWQILIETCKMLQTKTYYGKNTYIVQNSEQFLPSRQVVEALPAWPCLILTLKVFQRDVHVLNLVLAQSSTTSCSGLSVVDPKFECAREARHTVYRISMYLGCYLDFYWLLVV